MRRIIGLVLSFALLMCSMVACGTSDSSSAASNSGNANAAGSTNTAKKTLKIGFSMSSKEGVIYQAFEDYMIKAGKEKGIEVMMAVAEGDAGKQAKDVEDLISRKPDAMVLMAVDSKAIVASIKACKDAGIPVLTYNRPETPDATTKPDGTVMLDSTAQGYNSCKALFEQMKAAGVKDIKVLNVLGALNDENAVNRDKGMKKACAEAGVKILQDIPTDWNPDKALSGVSAAFQAHPDANAIFCPSDFLLAGIQAGMERSKKWIPAGQPGHIYFASCDAFPAGIQALKGKYMDQCAAFDIWSMSTKAIEYIQKLVNKEAVDPKKVEVNPPLITPENLATSKGVWGNEYKE